MRAAVIGSGVGGLATAIRLALRGVKVTVYEKNGTPGGKISQIRDSGYRFDTGPSLFTLPGLIDELLGPESGFNYLPLENSCRYFYPDGTQLNFFNNPVKLKEEIESKTDESYNNITKRLRESEQLYNLTSPLFIFNSFHKIMNFLNPKYRAIPLKLHKLGFNRTMHSANKRLFRDKRIVQLFDRYATYNGSSPYRAPATLNMISHLEHNIGAFFPVKGMYSIVESLFKRAAELGVDFKFNTLVNEIIVEKKRAKGVLVKGDYIFYDTIICNSDVRYAAANMFDKKFKNPLGRSATSQEPSTSALIFYWGIKREFQLFDVHNILFSSNYREEFKWLFKKGKIYHDPTIYIFISSKIVPEDAPQGCQNWFVMVNAPWDRGEDWHGAINQARENIIRKINSLLISNQIKADISDYITLEHIATPLTIEKNTLSSKGALYGNSSNSVFSAFLRHPNFSGRVKNLYFAGGSVHPGGGVPLCVAGASIVERLIFED